MYVCMYVSTFTKMGTLFMWYLCSTGCAVSGWCKLHCLKSLSAPFYLCTHVWLPTHVHAFACVCMCTRACVRNSLLAVYSGADVSVYVHICVNLTECTCVCVCVCISVCVCAYVHKCVSTTLTLTLTLVNCLQDQAVHITLGSKRIAMYCIVTVL